ncbi:MAG TPA: 30S ribosomal protein S8 [Patescibacteria group bacterium]|nr:30S ribosomal protein S8 [Patescibacteria group bacterium]
MTDPIADMLIRIKNAYAAHHATVVVPSSKVKEAIGNVLVANKYVESMEKRDIAPQPELFITLSYAGRTPAITKIKRISKPGRRFYSAVDNIDRTLGGYGITIISTSQGVMTDREAKKKNIGGEVLCQVW